MDATLLDSLRNLASILATAADNIDRGTVDTMFGDTMPVDPVECPIYVQDHLAAFLANYTDRCVVRKADRDELESHRQSQREATIGSEMGY